MGLKTEENHLCKRGISMEVVKDAIKLLFGILKSWDFWVAVILSLVVVKYGYSVYFYQFMPVVIMAVIFSGVVLYIILLVSLEKDIAFSRYLEELGVERKFWLMYAIWYIIFLPMIFLYNRKEYEFFFVLSEIYSLFYTLSMGYVVYLLPRYRKKFREKI